MEIWNEMERFCTPYPQFLFKVTSCISRGQCHNKEADIDTLYLCWSYPGFSNKWTVNFQMFKLILEKAEEPDRKSVV